MLVGNSDEVQKVSPKVFRPVGGSRAGAVGCIDELWPVVSQSEDSTFHEKEVVSYT